MIDSFPGRLCRKREVKRDGKIKEVNSLDVGREGIYDLVAQWLFEVLLVAQAQKVRVDLVSVANEPEFDSWLYGHEDPREGLGLWLKHSFPKLRERVKRQGRVAMPRVMGPTSCTSPAAGSYLGYFKKTHPEAWGQLDVISYHSYFKGDDPAAHKALLKHAEGKELIQSEMHVNRNDSLGDLSVKGRDRAALSLFTLMSGAINGGANAWFFCQAHNPKDLDDPVSLVRLPYGGAAEPKRMFHVFRQINCYSGSDVSVVRTDCSDRRLLRAFSFRKENSRELVVHAANLSRDRQWARLIVRANAEQNYAVSRVVNASVTGPQVDMGKMPKDHVRIQEGGMTFLIPPHSVASLKLSIRR